MKSVTVNQVASSVRRRYKRSDGSPLSSNNYSTTILKTQLVSSTNTYQNHGDHRTGTSYSYSRNEYIPLQGTSSYTDNTILYMNEGSFGQPTNFASNHVIENNFSRLNAESRAIDKLYEKIRGNVDLSIDAFQVRQTLNMLRKPLAGLASITREARREAKRRGLSDITSSLWLEYTYGWSPLLSTIYDTAKLMGRIDDSRSPQLFRAKGTDIKEFSGLTGGKSLPGVGTVRGRYAARCTSYASVYALMDLSNKTKAQKAAEYTSLNPVSIAWELQPYSFVIDWFADISGYLRSMESAIIYDSSLIAAWGSRLGIYETDSYFDTLDKAFGTTPLSADIRGYVKRIEFTRFRYAGLPRPKIPVINTYSDLSWRRLTSATALLRQLMKR